MYTIINTTKGRIQAGGRKSNAGKIVQIRAIGSSTVVVERLFKGERVYNNKRVNRALKAKQTHFDQLPSL